MSKSKGNVYYSDDLLARGFRKDHVRFFLIFEGAYTSVPISFTLSSTSSL